MKRRLLAKCCIRILAVLVIIAGCGNPGPVVVVENISWPDGAVVSIIQDGRIVDRSVLYGDYLTLRAENPGMCRIRAGEPGSLTWLSEEVHVAAGENHVSLPAPSARRRTARGMFGLFLRDHDRNTARALIFENPVPGITTLTVDFPSILSFEDMRALAATAHANAVELIVCSPVTSLPEDSGLGSMLPKGLDMLELTGADGVLLDPVSDIISLSAFPQFIRVAAREAHLRGLTLSVKVSDSWPEQMAPDALFRDVPAPERPDMIRIGATVPSAANLSPDIVLNVERITDRLTRAGVPSPQISADIAMSAASFVPGQGGGYTQAPVEPGTLDTIVHSAGTDAVMRLRDGTLRLGSKGIVYSFEDVEGLAWKIGRLRESTLAPLGGVHVVYDGRGIQLDRNGLKQLSDVFGDK